MVKKIHYCWFGKNPKSDLILNCIESWRKFCPEYEIKEWNEDNFDINCCRYVQEAYENKKWAFVSDYCRFWILYNFGGVYLDTDVELLKSIEDLPNTFVGFENQFACNSGLIRGANARDKICEQMLDSYKKDKFVLAEGVFNTKTVCQRETALLQTYGLKLDGNKQIVADTTIFPIEYFCPLNYETKECNITDKTYSIHHYDASWLTDEDKYSKQLAKKIRFMPKRLAGKIAHFIAICKYRGLRIALRTAFKKKSKNEKKKRKQ